MEWEYDIRSWTVLVCHTEPRAGEHRLWFSTRRAALIASTPRPSRLIEPPRLISALFRWPSGILPSCARILLVTVVG